ncbi:MAG: PepSY domain-containing protein [Bacteroidota bacterium]|nr:PepSY domain-containing protein [Bacteroidota bacterium]
MRPYCAAVLLAVFASCMQSPPPRLTGRVTDRATGEGIEGVRIRVGDREGVSVRDGSYVVDSVHAGDTVRLARDGYAAANTVLVVERNEKGVFFRNFEMDKLCDTAYTAAGPVDAELFLGDARLVKKKLSPNEARAAVIALFPDAKVPRGSLVVVDGREEWVFDLRFGHASATLFLDARTGEIRSIQSDDPNLDRKLQEMVRK